MESTEAEEDSGIKPEREEDAESSAKEDAETLSGVGGADQSVGYIVCLANAVTLYQRKNLNCFACGSPDHLMKDCPKSEFKCKRGDGKEGSLGSSQTSSSSTDVPGEGS